VKVGEGLLFILTLTHTLTLTHPPLTLTRTHPHLPHPHPHPQSRRLSVVKRGDLNKDQPVYFIPTTTFFIPELNDKPVTFNIV
jgi:hypothetical protein